MTELEKQRMLAAITRGNPGYTSNSNPTLANVGQQAVDAGMTSGMVGGYVDAAKARSERENAEAMARSFKGQESNIAAQRARAAALRGKGMPQNRMINEGTPYATLVNPNWGETLEGVTGKLLGGYLEGQAIQDAEQLDVDQTEQARLVLATEAAEKEAELALEASLAAQAQENFEATALAKTTAATVKNDREVKAAEVAAGVNAGAAELKANALAKGDWEPMNVTFADGENGSVVYNKKTGQYRLGSVDGPVISSEDAKKLLKYVPPTSKNGGHNGPKTQKEREEFDNGAKLALQTQDLINTFEDDYVQPQIIRSFGLGSQAEKFEKSLPGSGSETEDNIWWTKKESMELGPRHEMFGSAFTPTEKAAYEATTFDNNADPAFIRAQLAERLKLETRASERMAAQALMKGYDPEQVLYNFGDVVDVEKIIFELENGTFKQRVRQEQEEYRNKKENTEDTENIEDIENINIDSQLESIDEQIRILQEEEEAARLGAQ